MEFNFNFLLALLAMVLSSAAIARVLFNKPTVQGNTLRYFFQSDAIEAMYYDEDADDIRFPHYGSDEAAGFDIRAAEVVTLDPGQFMTIKTGIHFDIPEGYELQIRSRSGLAAKHGIQVLNSPGTIDSDYTGELKVILRNGGANRYTIRFAERIAQAVFAKVAKRPQAEQVHNKQMLTVSLRGEGGLGSTGVN